VSAHDARVLPPKKAENTKEKYRTDDVQGAPEQVSLNFVRWTLFCTRFRGREFLRQHETDTGRHSRLPDKVESEKTGIVLVTGANCPSERTSAAKSKMNAQTNPATKKIGNGNSMDCLLLWKNGSARNAAKMETR